MINLKIRKIQARRDSQTIWRPFVTIVSRVDGFQEGQAVKMFLYVYIHFITHGVIVVSDTYFVMM